MDAISMNRIRDEVGASPDDDTIEEWFDELGHWIPVTLRVLKRRRADAAGGGQEASSFTLSGVLSVNMGKANLTALDGQIERLEARWAALNGEAVTTGITVAPILRPDRYR